MNLEECNGIRKSIKLLIQDSIDENKYYVKIEKDKLDNNDLNNLMRNGFIIYSISDKDYILTWEYSLNRINKVETIANFISNLEITDDILKEIASISSKALIYFNIFIQSSEDEDRKMESKVCLDKDFMYNTRKNIVDEIYKIVSRENKIIRLINRIVIDYKTYVTSMSNYKQISLMTDINNICGFYLENVSENILKKKCKNDMLSVKQLEEIQERIEYYIEICKP